MNWGPDQRLTMTIIGINKDELAEGSGNTAKYTWWSRVMPTQSYQMNPANDGTEGTGTIGGWEHCTMRCSTLAEDGVIWNALPNALRADGAIKLVKKYSRIYNVSGEVENDVVTSDKLFILSARELGFTSQTIETSGPVYDEYFTSEKKRIGYVYNQTGASHYWARTAYNNSNFGLVYNTGTYAYYNANYSTYIALGFCT